MNNKSKAILITGACAAGVAVSAAVSAFVTRTLLKIAIDREAPKGIDKVREKILNSPKLKDSTSLIEEKARALEACELEAVRIQGVDGERLVGHWYENKNAKRIIVAMHGWRSSWSSEFGMIAPFWHENGCSVLYAEQRGHDESGGEYLTFGMCERYDCREWVEWVNEHNPHKLPIYLAGVSMGASTVLLTSGLDLPENVHGVIADCGYTSPHAIWKHVVNNNLHLSYNLRGEIINGMFKKKTSVGSKELSTVDALKNAKAPVLFIHGTADNFVPIEMTYENYTACASPKRLLVVPGASHALSYYVDRESYERAVSDFWRDYD